MANHARHGALSIYRSAITEADGQAVNVWYLAIFWSIVILFPAVTIMVVGAIIEATYAKDHVFPYQALGTGIGLVIAAFGASLTAISASMRGQAGNQP
jgi:hypothetical protein